jgi:hypothetical protein
VITFVAHEAVLTVRTSLPMERPDPTPVTPISSTLLRSGLYPAPPLRGRRIVHRLPLARPNRTSRTVLILNVEHPARADRPGDTGQTDLRQTADIPQLHRVASTPIRAIQDAPNPAGRSALPVVNW